MRFQPAARCLFAICASSSFAFAQLLDFTATAPETVLDTDSTQVQPTVGPPITVTGGLFRFRNVRIPPGTVVRGVGSKPMVWIVDHMVVDGELTVSGADGQIVHTIGGADIPALGGRGGANGGHGGAGSTQVFSQTLSGQAGNGPGDSAGLGGGGGQLSLPAGCSRGSGGGGGALATLGDPHYKTPAGTGTSFVQRSGVGGFGCLGASGAATRSLQGGGPGGLLGSGNLFFGSGYDVHQGAWIQGTLPVPIGGAGGGGGGDRSHDNLLLSPAFVSDARGGGGGGGGGCLVIISLTDLVVGPTGRVTANGGNGGAGERSPASTSGGGGGGSGGTLILAALGRIQLHVKGETYANDDYDFTLSADGGVCRTSVFSPPIVLGKYPNSGQPTISGAVYDQVPLGGFGGMGIVQLFARPGGNSDGTNTILDDSIDVWRNGALLTGAQKQRYLAWRGYPDAQGVFVDDSGTPTNIGDDEGDIRPAPYLLPLL